MEKLFMFVSFWLIALTEQSAPSWPTMEWCWLQTGWQGPQGGKGGATCKPAAQTDSDSSFITSSSSSPSPLCLQTGSSPPPPLSYLVLPHLLPCSLSFLSFLSDFSLLFVCLLRLSLSFGSLSWWNLLPVSRRGQYELAEQVKPPWSWEPVWSDRRPPQPLHRRPGDLPHGVQEPLETGGHLSLSLFLRTITSSPLVFFSP